MTQAAPEPVQARTWRLLAAVIVAAVALALAAVVVLYLARRQLAREAVTDWLRSRGVSAQASFQEIGPGRLVGALRIGPPDAPDLTVDRAEVDYSLAGLIGGRGVEVTSVRLTRLVLKASFRHGRFTAGALDRLIQEFRNRPPRPGAPAPRVEIDQGRIALTTDYGLLRVTADALIDKGRLVRLDADSAPVLVAREGTEAGLGAATLQARSVGDRLSVSLRAPVLRARTPKGEVESALLTLTSDGAYPDLTRPVVASGQANLELSAGTARLGASTAQGLRVAATSAWRWTRSGGVDALAGDLQLAAGLQDLLTSGLQLSSASGDFQGRYALGAAPSLQLAGQAQMRGGWRGMGAPVRGDSRQIAALKRGLAAFHATAGGLTLAADARGVQARLTGAARLDPDRGGEIRLAPQGVGYRLTSSGGGLPRVQADVRRVAFANGAVSATGSVAAALSVGPLQQAKLRADGVLRVAGGTAAFTAARCAPMTAARFMLGANELQDLAARICPAGGPLLTVGKGGFSLAARAERASAAAPFLKAAVDDGAGALRLAERGGRLFGSFQLAHAAVRDTAPAERFRPMVVSGHGTVVRDLWTGGFDARLSGGAQVAHAALRQDGAGAGQIALSTPVLAFAPGGLQPADLSPAAAALGKDVAGQASFSGAFRWTKAGASSDGEVSIPGLSFKSPAGAVSGLSGQVRLTSLAPLVAPPGQTLHIATIASALPVTDATVSLAMQATGLTLSGRGAAGGGELQVQDLSIPFAPDQPVTGALQLVGVQLRDLVKASPFGDRVQLDAKVSGRIPFETQGGKVRISGGELHAIAPGRLSISRAALSSVSAQSSMQASPGAAPAGQAAGSTDTFTDFAYQAMENLAFDKLDARVDTRPDDRLGVLFHIVGYHDPPKHQEISISWLDLVRRKFLGKKLPLPSGTKVDLTLDTTLNLDDLLKDYADFERLRSSPPVQR